MSYEVSVVRKLEKIVHVILALHGTRVNLSHTSLCTFPNHSFPEHRDVCDLMSPSPVDTFAFFKWLHGKCSIHFNTYDYIQVQYRSLCVQLQLTFNSSPPSAVYMGQWIGPALVQVMACCQFGAKSWPEPILGYCQLDSWEQMSVHFKSKCYHFHSRKCIWSCYLPNWWPFCPERD